MEKLLPRAPHPQNVGPAAHAQSRSGMVNCGDFGNSFERSFNNPTSLLAEFEHGLHLFCQPACRVRLLDECSQTVPPKPHKGLNLVEPAAKDHRDVSPNLLKVSQSLL